MNSLSDILTGLSAVWDNLTDQEQANLAKTIAGTNQYSKLQTIMAGCSEQAAKGGQSFSDYASALENCSGTAGKMAGTMLDNLNGKMTLFESAADGLEIAVGEKLTPAMSDLYEVGADVLSGMTEFVNDNPGVVKGITTTVAVLGTAAAGIAGVTAAVNLASAAAAAFTAVTSVALGPVALAVAGVAAVAGAFVAVTSAADAAVEASGDWPPALDEITTAASGVTDALDDANATMQASAETTMATAGTADLYITKLEEMGDYAKLSADDQQEYRNVLTLLCDLIPDLAGYIDTTTGKIQGGTTALRGYAKAWQDSAKAQATKGKLVIYDQSDYEQRPVVIEADYRDTSFTKWKLDTKTADTKYARCRVSYVEPATGACIEYTAYTEDYDEDAKTNQQLELYAKVGSVAEAKAMAEKHLRLHNKFSKTVQFTHTGHVWYVAGVGIRVKGYGFWDGRYICTQAKHTINENGFTTTVTGRRILEGY